METARHGTFKEGSWEPSYLGHLAGTQDIASGLGAKQQHRHAGGLFAQLPHDLYQHLHEGDTVTHRSPDSQDLPGRTWPSAGPRQGHCTALTERDSAETVSTITGPGCRFNSSWDFSVACGAEEQQRGQGWVLSF